MKQLFIIIDNSQKKKRIADQFYVNQRHYFYYEDIAELVRTSGVPILPEFLPDEMDLCIHLKKAGNKFTNFTYFGTDIEGNLLFSNDPYSEERDSKEVSLCIIL